MNPLQQTKFVAVIPPVSIKDNASWVEVEIDCIDYDFLTVIVTLGAMDIAMVALKMQETDTTGSGEADITGLIFGTSADIAGVTSALPVDTQDGKIYVFEVDLRKRKRFLSLVATGGDGSAGTYLSAVGILSRGDATPVTAAQRGCAQILRV